MTHRVDSASIRKVLESATWPSIDGATLQRAISGDMPTDLRDAMRSDLLVAGTQAQVDEVACAVLRHHGLNPAVLFAMCIHATDITVSDDHGYEIVSIGSDGLSRVRLGDDPKGAAWRTMGGYLENLPVAVSETICTISVGKPVTALIVHPAIDPLGLTIKQVDRLPGNSYLQVDGFKWVTGGALAHLLEEDACA